MKFYYILKDFFISGYGKIAASSILIIIATIFFSHRIKEKHPPINQQTSKKPSLWESDISHSTQQSERNIAFEPFTPITSKPKNEKVQPPPSRKPPTETPQIVVQQLAPLIKVERKSNQIKKLKNKTTPALPQLESGAIIHCRLLTPATTDHPNLPVIAQITRSVIRDGITLIPKGSKLIGSVHTAQNKRIFFASDWKVYHGKNQILNLSAQVQEKSYNHRTRSFSLADGRAGLAGSIVNHSPTKHNNLLGHAVKGITTFSKDAVRGAVTKHLPTPAKDVTIQIGSDTIGSILPQEKNEKPYKPYILVPAGEEFYLILSDSKNTSFYDHSQISPLDKLLEEAARKRLNR